jgi:hypothetical protein
LTVKGGFLEWLTDDLTPVIENSNSDFLGCYLVLPIEVLKGRAYCMEDFLYPIEEVAKMLWFV